jgi:hypothetical protein
MRAAKFRLTVSPAVFGIGATVGSLVAGLARRLPVWPVLVASVIGWGAALAPMGLLRLPVLALAKRRRRRWATSRRASLTA